MQISFYPGCSLEGMANDYGHSITAVFDRLGIEAVELEDWSCCGSTAAHSLSEMMALILPARNLAAAEKVGLDLVTPCANCFNRLSYSQKMIQKRLFDVPWEVKGDGKVHDMTRFLAQPEMIARIGQKVARPLKGLKVVCYYGCQTVRSPRITGYSDFENPQTLDMLAAAAGAEVIDWSFKSTCCGASIGIARKDIQESLTRRIYQKALQAGAEAIVVSCPLCQVNLDVIQKDATGQRAPVFYFTELLRLAFEGGGVRKWFRAHLTDPVPLLTEKGLL
ncbi:MAG: CoB--CoM heterodisulfide reductase iron-sulfur subunit B family protein [Deltaproteobacteria bacterium]|jgi:heterodisulfide reductase subunit B2|nr:CoB--CoM heterodisulfide reductase iron-sulfur subunit B family protein [Deltaproteobacteria bacterium]